MIEKYDKEFMNFIDRNINENNAEDILSNNKSICNSFINSYLVSDKLFVFVLKYADEKINSIKSSLSKDRIKVLIKNNLIEITSDNIKTILDNSYNEELVMLANSEDQDIEDNVITQLMSHGLSDDLIYMLVNSNISDLNAIKLINTTVDEVLIERIDTVKEAVIENIIDNGLSDKNINFICKNFETFKFKAKFIDYLQSHNELDELDNSNLNDHVMCYILNTDITVDIKISLIIKKISNRSENAELKKYISYVKEISEIANVWDNKFPSIDNAYQEKIVRALIEAEYIKKRKDGKLMINKGINKTLEDHLL